MGKIVEYLAEARVDFDVSFDWYRHRSERAALGFCAAVDAALDQILADPSRFPLIHGECRYCPLRRYPFRIVFRAEADRLVVVALVHAKRRPGFWHDRT